MYASLGEGALASAKGSRGLAVQHLRELFDDAAQYKKNKRAFERNQTRSYAAGRLDLEALLAVKSGAMPLVFRVHRASDILAAIRLGRELGIRVIIEGGVEAWTVADELAAAKIPVILDPAANLPRSFDRTRVRNDAAAVLAAAGVPILISTLGDAAGARTIRQLAGIAIANGLDRKTALAALTTTPAATFGIKDRGRIVRGAAADLVVWSGDPFELSTRVEHMLVAGKSQSLESHQTRLLERYR